MLILPVKDRGPSGPPLLAFVFLVEGFPHYFVNVSLERTKKGALGGRIEVGEVLIEQKAKNRPLCGLSNRLLCGRGSDLGKSECFFRVLKKASYLLD